MFGDSMTMSTARHCCCHHQHDMHAACDTVCCSMLLSGELQFSFVPTATRTALNGFVLFQIECISLDFDVVLLPKRVRPLLFVHVGIRVHWYIFRVFIALNSGCCIHKGNERAKTTESSLSMIDFMEHHNGHDEVVPELVFFFFVFV